MEQNRFCYHCMTPLPEGAHTCPHCGVDTESVHNNPNQLAVGSILAGTYLVGRALGQGGFGITYIGYDINLELRVAIKEYFPQGFVSRAQFEVDVVTDIRDAEPALPERATHEVRAREYGAHGELVCVALDAIHIHAAVGAGVCARGQRGHAVVAKFGLLIRCHSIRPYDPC